MAQVSYEYLSSRPPSLLTSQLPYDDLLQGPKGFAGRLYGCASEVLKVVKLQGALFYNAEFSSPWSVYAASSSGLARFFATGIEHVIVYHLLTEGRASARLKDGDRVPLQAGDIVMIPHVVRSNL